MKLTNERPSTDTIFDCDLEGNEWDLLLNHGLENCPQEDLDAFLINWAMVDILGKQIELMEKGTTDNDALERLGVEVSE